MILKTISNIEIELVSSFMFGIEASRECQNCMKSVPLQSRVFFLLFDIGACFSLISIDAVVV